MGKSSLFHETLNPVKRPYRKNRDKPYCLGPEAAVAIGCPLLFVRIMLDLKVLNTYQYRVKSGWKTGIERDPIAFRRAREKWRTCLIQWNKQVSQG